MEEELALHTSGIDFNRRYLFDIDKVTAEMVMDGLLQGQVGRGLGAYASLKKLKPIISFFSLLLYIHIP